MANQIVNAAPMVIDYGTQDLSTRQLPREPELIPQHLPKFFIFAKKGPTEPQLCVGAERDRIYGTETFNPRSKYFNHATVFANAVNAEGNACMYERVIPEDAGPQATALLSLDVLQTTVDLYQRNDDGSIYYNDFGEPVITGTAPGFKVKWVVDHFATEAEMTEFGARTMSPGDQVDEATTTQSNRYPIMDLKYFSKGQAGNVSGIRMWAPTTKTIQTMPSKLMNVNKVYPYYISVIRRADEFSTPTPVETLFGEQKLMITLKPNTIDPLTERQMYLGEVFVDAYQNLTDLRYAKQYGDFSEISVYQDNIDTLVQMFHAAESDYIDAYSDFSDNVADAHLFNMVTGVSSFNVPYHSFTFVDGPDSVRMSEYTNIYAAGGSDGTMTDEDFADLVEARMQAYLDPNNEVQELATNVESIFYDSGFPLWTKYALCNAIAVRKDTAVVLGTHTVGERTLSASEEHSIAIALRTRLQMYPESDYFGTPVMRGMIVGRSGKIRNSLYTKEVPLTYEVAVKSARYMGAGNGAWTNGANFDGAPGSVIETMYDLNITWVPASVRNRNWDVGLNWVQAYDRRSYFFPALKTVYDNDTSVLNSYLTMLACCHLNKVAHACWREFSGVSSLSNVQLVQRVNDFVIQRTQNKFDGRFVIQPDAFFTDMDVLRGFSWTLPIKIFAQNMKTVMTTYVQAFRAEDLEA